MADKKNSNVKTIYTMKNSIFLYDTINQDTCAELIGELAEMVANLKAQPKTASDLATIKSPYELNKQTQVLDIFINSPGGSCSFMDSIMTFVNIARSKGAIIRTTVTGRACSCASQIAIQGTPGFRIMYENAYNLIHYGNTSINVSAEGEVERAAQNEKQLRQHQSDTYKKFTKLTTKEIAKCMATEHHVFSAKQCLEKNMCDWILTDMGTFIQRSDLQR